MEENDEMTKEAAIAAMEQGGYKVAHRFFSEGEYIWSVDDEYYKDEEGIWIPKKDFLGMSYKTRMGNRMENSGLKIIYLDIMVKDRFVTQIPYPHCTLFPIDSEELKNFVLEKRPSLKNKDFRIEFSNNKVK